MDIGFGEGTFLELATGKGFDCVGVERFAIERERSFQYFSVLDDVLKSFGAGSFDAITLWHSLEHLTDPGGCMADVCSLLSKNGSVFIAVPNFSSLQARLFERDWLHLDVPRHMTHFSPIGLDNLLKRHGLKTVEVWHHESEYDIMGWSQSFLNKIFSKKNVFFNTLTGKAANANGAEKAIHFVLGSVASIAAIPLVLLDIATKRGGTIVIRVTKQSS
ncbi:MAG: class I SAM-dependent methyltransferase [Blastocatellia bacterium]|nr:class I SAM-dependent methyltransferase [Blastocatellia bacterium]